MMGCDEAVRVFESKIKTPIMITDYDYDYD